MAIVTEEPVFDNAGMSTRAQNFIMQCLAKHQEDRPTIAELSSHPWIKVRGNVYV